MNNFGQHEGDYLFRRTNGRWERSDRASSLQQIASVSDRNFPAIVVNLNRRRAAGQTIKYGPSSGFRAETEIITCATSSPNVSFKPHLPPSITIQRNLYAMEMEAIFQTNSVRTSINFSSVLFLLFWARVVAAVALILWIWGWQKIFPYAKGIT